MGDIHQPTSQNRTGWFSNQSFGEGMKPWDEICKIVNVTHEQIQQINETAKIVGVSCRQVLEAFRFSDERALIFPVECSAIFWWKIIARRRM